MYSIILVSHSKKITDGLKEMIEEMVVNDKVTISSCGGADDGRLGTNSIAILEEVEKNSHADQIYIFADIGSAILSVETAIDLLDDETLKEKTLLVDAPLVEASFAVAVQCSVGASKEDIDREVLEVKKV